MANELHDSPPKERKAQGLNAPHAAPRAAGHPAAGGGGDSPTPRGERATARPEATREPGGVMPKLAGARAGGSANIQRASVSAGRLHTCGVRTGGSVACWGQQARGLTAPAGG